jgi:hypothetical protein
MIKNIGVFSLGFLLCAFSFWLGGADFKERGFHLENQFDACFLFGLFCICIYQASLAHITSRGD